MPRLRRLWNTIRSGGLERDIARELAFHIEERADALQAEGLTREEALRRARLQFGNVTLQVERTRDADVSMALDAALRDARHAIRSFARTPGFTLSVVLTLALGIGANTAVFSVLDAVVLRPLPFPDGDRLVQLRQRAEGEAENNVAPARLDDWHRMNGRFAAISGYYTEDVSDASGDLPERVRRALVAPHFLDVWGVAPAVGRGFSADEHRFGGPAAVLISHRYWRDRLGGDPDVIGRPLRVGSASPPVVGVMPATFLFPDRTVDLWYPVPMDAPFAQSREATWFLGIGRLKPGVSPSEAAADLTAVQASLAQEYPATDRRLDVRLEPLKDVAVAGVRGSLWVLFAAVSVLLLITCTNVAALLLARATRRGGEIAIRVSLGASQLAIARQVLIETLLLSLAGAAGGLAVASGVAAWLRGAALDLPRLEEMAVEARLVLYASAIAVLVALACGALPALRAARDRTGNRLRHAGRALGAPGQSLQWWMVGAQVALSVTLLAGAGLLVRSAQELWRVQPGFDLDRVLAFRVSGHWGETVDQGALIARMDRRLERLRELPGVEAVATAGFSLPGVPTGYEVAFEVVETRSDADARLVAESRAVSPGYFATMRIPVLAGELCRPRTAEAGGGARPTEVMVNQAFVRRYLAGAGASPIGLHLARVDGGREPDRIAGVVGDARERGLDREPGPVVYWCDPAPNPSPYFVVRTAGDPAAMGQTVRLALKELEPLRAVYELAPLGDRVEGAFAQERLRMALLVVFAAAALSLAAVGLAGTLGYAVTARRRDIGVRLALGARRRRIRQDVMVQGLRVVGPACVAGLALTIAGSRLLAHMLYGVSPTDPFVLALVLAVVGGVAVVAALVPAARAAAVEPVTVLREG
jgi:putative ABC transport system permease protein